MAGSCWLTPAVQTASLPCSRRGLCSAFPFFSESSSPSLPLFAVWLCLSSLLSRSPLIRLWVLYSYSLGWAEREIDCSQFSSRLNCIDLSPIHADEELCYLLITTAIPPQHQLNGCVCGECGGSWGEYLGGMWGFWHDFWQGSPSERATQGRSTTSATDSIPRIESCVSSVQ